MKSDSLLWIVGGIAAAVLLGGGGALVYSAVRGIRNNNPGNIVFDGTQWQGLANPPSDGTFCIFIAPEWGIRAMATILSNYVALDGVASTVTAIISRWAPPASNDTASYIVDVCDQLGLTPGFDAIDLSVEMLPLIAAIISHENGIQPYANNTLALGISMAA